jgi:bifunctional DNA-binding transcriptional regulator/antitoxin component of YhaV-PrlF toxin-antitoxin module
MSDKVKAKKANLPFKRTRKGRTLSSRVSSKNQVTIPVEILRQAGIAPNELVNFKFNKSGEIVIAKADSAIESLFGALSGTYVDFDLRKERDEWGSKY